MSAVIHTKFAGRNPFQPKQKKPRAEPKAVNLDSIQVANDPMPAGRAKATEHKYDPLFGTLKPGQCLKCDPADVGKISHAMGVWIKRVGLKDHVVRSTKKYETDGMGRVWLIKLGAK